jgi:hypothetical protein
MVKRVLLAAFVSLSPVLASANIVSNPSFENGATGWTVQATPPVSVPPDGPFNLTFFNIAVAGGLEAIFAGIGYMAYRRRNQAAVA